MQFDEINLDLYIERKNDCFYHHFEINVSFKHIFLTLEIYLHQTKILVPSTSHFCSALSDNHVESIRHLPEIRFVESFSFLSPFSFFVYSYAMLSFSSSNRFLFEKRRRSRIWIFGEAEMIRTIKDGYFIMGKCLFVYFFLMCYLDTKGSQVRAKVCLSFI